MQQSGSNGCPLRRVLAPDCQVYVKKSFEICRIISCATFKNVDNVDFVSWFFFKSTLFFIIHKAPWLIKKSNFFFFKSNMYEHCSWAMSANKVLHRVVDRVRIWYME
jgi:hypothetical protein